MQNDTILTISSIWDRDRPLWLFIICYLVSFLLALLSTGSNHQTEFLTGLAHSLSSLFATGILYWILLYTGNLLLLQRPASPLQIIKRDFLNSNGLKRVLSSCALLAIIVISAGTFTAFKQLISALVPFYADPILMTLDKYLHGGIHPYEWLLPTSARFTRLLDLIYILWLPITNIFVFYHCWHFFQQHSSRAFIYSLILVWTLLGSYLALLLSSAGPCYFDKITGDTESYAGLVAYLNTADSEIRQHNYFFLNFLVADRENTLIAHLAQDWLWASYTSSTEQLGAGISAMPSIHVATAMLILLSALQNKRRSIIITLPYLILILIGSIHLGWHYAIDGYVSIILTTLIWLIVNHRLQRKQKT